MTRLRGVKLRRLARAAAQRIAPGTLILLYHRVAEPDCDPWSLCVSPGHFDEHLAVLRGRVRPLAALSATEKGGSGAAGCVVVTFDDGYADVGAVARPLLERYDVPATVFITTGGVGCGAPFWWDELAALLLRPRTLPGELELRIRGVLHRFALRDENCGSGPSDAKPERDVSGGVSGATRAQLLQSIHRLLGDLMDEERSEQLVALRAWANVRTPPEPVDRVLRGDEVVGFSFNVVNRETNERYSVQEGWVSDLGVRRAWRKRGIASALLCASMRTFKATGLDDAMLGVDTGNPTGALRLYERLGFVQVKRFITFEKPVGGSPVTDA